MGEERMIRFCRKGDLCFLQLLLLNVLPIQGLTAALVLCALACAQAQELPMEQDRNSQALALEEKRIVSILQDKLAELEKREEAVRAKEKELKILRKNVENTMERMQQIRAGIEDRIEKQRRLRMEKVKELSGIYENMNAARAAQAMLSMDRDLAIGILSNMRRKLAGEVLDQMPGEKAAEISRDYSNMGGEPPP
jgi:flagellar motility protein MotE (MotC chaperone)